MSSIDEARALRYLIDSLNDALDADIMLDHKRYSSALFHTEQSCEKATKACLAIVGVIGLKDHVIFDHVKDEILPVTEKLKDEFKSYRNFLIQAESYYIPSRYGVDIAGRISFDHYDESEIRSFMLTSRNYIDLCFRFVEEKTGKRIPRILADLTRYFITSYSGFITK
jgi:HEPN domain-containing protein